jgi:hypothetical protein
MPAQTTEGAAGMITERFHYTVTAEVILTTDDINTIMKEALRETGGVLVADTRGEEVHSVVRKKFRRNRGNPDTHCGRINREEAVLLAQALEDFADEGYESPMFDKFVHLTKALDEEHKRINNLVGI